MDQSSLTSRSCKPCRSPPAVDALDALSTDRRRATADADVDAGATSIEAVTARFWPACDLIRIQCSWTLSPDAFASSFDRYHLTIEIFCRHSLCNASALTSVMVAPNCQYRESMG
eukprot:1394762-Rhodomonas_salina.1